MIGVDFCNFNNSIHCIQCNIFYITRITGKNFRFYGNIVDTSNTLYTNYGSRK